MSCKSEDKTAQIIEHLKHHTQSLCPQCQKPMLLEDGHLPFGEATMVTFTCSDCQLEDVKLLKEDGVLYSVAP